MSVDAVPMFSPAALAILDRMPFDPAAKGEFELMTGGLTWPDEFPRPASRESAPVFANYTFRYLLGYRASLTLGEERAEFRAVWEQVVAGAPNWPGLRPERRGDRARHRLLAALKRQERCFEEMDWEAARGEAGADEPK